MALTRINNDQISDAINGNSFVGIDANTKLQNSSVTSSKLANSLSISGNLAVGSILTNNYYFANGTPFAGAQGTTGTQGATGTQGGTGAATTILGSVPTVAGQSTLNTAFPSAVIGDGAIAEDTGNLWVVTSTGPTTWIDIGQIVGPQGTTGTQGIQGVQGIQGITGSQGVQGTQGIQGFGSDYGNANVSAYLASGTNTANIITTGNVIATNITTTGSDGNITGVDYYLGNVITVTGNVTGSYILGNGSQLTGMYGNADVATYLASGTDTANITTTGNISANYLLGNGSQLTGLAISTLLRGPGGSDSELQLTSDAYLNLSYAGNLEAIIGVNYPNGGNADLTLNSIGGNVMIAPYDFNGAGEGFFYFDNTGNITLPGNTSAINYANGASILDSVSSSYGNANVATYLASGTDTANIITTGNISAANFTTTGAAGNITGVNYFLGNAVTVTGNVTATNFIGNGSQLTNLPVQSGTYTNANVAAYLPTYTGNVNAGNVNVVSAINAVGDITTFGDIVAAPGGFFVGDGSQLSGMYGNANVSNYLASGTDTANIITTGNITATNFIGNGSQLTDLPVQSGTYSNTNVAAYLNVFNGNIIPSANNTFTLGNLTNQWSSVYVSANTIYLNSVPLSANATTLFYDSLPLVSATPGGNIDTAGNVSAGFFIGDGSALTNLPIQPGTYSNANVTALLASDTVTSNIITTGNITANNIFSNTSVIGGVGIIGNAIYDLNGIIIENADLSHGATAALILPANGNTDSAQLNNTYGNLTIGLGASSTITETWAFTNDGNLTLPTSGIVKTGTGNITIKAAGETAENLPVANSVIIQGGNTGTGDGGHIVLQSGSAPGAGGHGGNVYINAAAGQAVSGAINFGIGGFNYGQIGSAVALGYLAGNANIQSSGIAIGTTAGENDQGLHGIAVGWNTGSITQGNSAVAIGENAAWVTQGDFAIAMGTVAARTLQGTNAIAIGTHAGFSSQGIYSIALGAFAGNNNQGSSSTAIGSEAGANTQGINSVAVGVASGFNTQGNAATALGSFAGQYTQGDFAVALGTGAAYTNQGAGAIAIGADTSPINQGDYSIAIGAGASTGNIQANNSIIIDATGLGATAVTNAGFYVNPVRNDTANVANVVYFNAATKEITYAPLSSSNIIANGTSNVSIPVANGNVTINSVTSGWTFSTDGNLTLPTNGNINFNNGGITQVQNQDFNIVVQDPTDDDSYAVTTAVDNGAGLPFTQTRLQSGSFAVSTDIQGSNYNWTFDSLGILGLPGNISGGTGVDSSFYVVDDGTNGSVELKTISFAGETLGSNVRVTQSNVTVSTNAAAHTWEFDNDGGLVVAPQSVVSAAGESARFYGTRKIVGGASATYQYSTALNVGGTPTVAYTSMAGTQSVKVTFAVQSNGAAFNFEQFDVVATPDQNNVGAVIYVVSNRVKANSTLTDTVVTATMNAGQIQISLNVDAAQDASNFASFDAVEFGLVE